MQIPITLEKNLFKIQMSTDPFGATVPFEVGSYLEDFQNSQKGGFFDLSDWGIIEISGPDAQDFLQRMTTVNFKQLSIQSVASGAFLNGRGGVVALGTFRKIEEGKFLFLTFPGQQDSSLEHIEKFHFQEKLEAKNVGNEWALVGIWAQAEQLKEKLGWSLGEPSQVWDFTCDSIQMKAWEDNRRPYLVWSELKRENVEELLKALMKRGFQPLGMHLFHFYRIQAALPWLGWEVTDKDLILEANLEDHVARNKGCYPGQEVVERIFTYGQVNRKLFRVELETDGYRDCLIKPLLIENGGEKVGELVSAVRVPGEPKRAVGLAYIRKKFWNSGDENHTSEGDRVMWQGTPERIENA